MNLSFLNYLSSLSCHRTLVYHVSSNTPNFPNLKCSSSILVRNSVLSFLSSPLLSWGISRRESRIYLISVISPVLFLLFPIFVGHWPQLLHLVTYLPYHCSYKSPFWITELSFGLTALSVRAFVYQYCCSCPFYFFLYSTLPLFCMLHWPFRDRLNQKMVRNSF